MCDPAFVLVGVGLQILCVYNLVLTGLDQDVESLGPSVCRRSNDYYMCLPVDQFALCFV